MSKKVIDNRLKTVEMVEKLHKTIYNQDQKISDLEAKLAVADDCSDRYWKQLGVVEDENEKLKQQLAEKDENIEKLKSENHALMSDNAYQEADIFELTQKLAIHNQDKISFAVEQLEKVKNRIESKVESVYKRLDDLNIKIVCESTSRQLSTYEEIVKEIDNQIKQLKEGK